MHKENEVYCSFTNNWGEDISLVKLSHWLTSTDSLGKREFVTQTINFMSDGATIERVLVFPFRKNIELCNDEQYDANGFCAIADNIDNWDIILETNSGKIYKLVGECICSLWYGDNNNYINLGVDRDDKKFYVNFSNYSGCYIYLKQVN
ncbi:TPA: hypothetical protein ACS7XF_000539 [Providencia alcalifaciens]